jgi:hypothetical protein
MKLQLGSVYMLPIKGDYMGLIPRRMWTKPWRYKVHAIEWGEVDTYTLIASNLTKDGVVGVFKLLDEPKSWRMK